MKGSIRSWIHYLEVRLDETTQKEHRDIALEISKVISEVFPIAFYTEN
jgi:thymidylate synthase (FAD)